jgi:hypothetical protein
MFVCFEKYFSNNKLDLAKATCSVKNMLGVVMLSVVMLSVVAPANQQYNVYAGSVQILLDLLSGVYTSDQALRRQQQNLLKMSRLRAILMCQQPFNEVDISLSQNIKRFRNKFIFLAFTKRSDGGA